MIIIKPEEGYCASVRKGGYEQGAGSKVPRFRSVNTVVKYRCTRAKY